MEFFILTLIERPCVPLGEETEGQKGAQGFPASGSSIERTHLGVLLQQEQECR